MIWTSHAWKKLLHNTNFAKLVIASFFGINTNIPYLKVFYNVGDPTSTRD